MSVIIVIIAVVMCNILNHEWENHVHWIFLLMPERRI